MKIKYAIFILSVLLFWNTAHAKSLKLVVDNRNWYPFSYSSAASKKVQGIHLDIVKKALTSLGYDVSINAFPRKRCIILSQTHQVDGMISVAYHTKLSESLDFPPGAESDRRSKFRITQVDYMVVTLRPNKFKYVGIPEDLPSPVRVPYGETIVSIPGNKSVVVEDRAKNDQANFLKLLRDKKGSVITTSIMAERIMEDLKIADQITIHATPFDSHSYFLAFSGKAPLSEAEKTKIWEEITRWRNDYVFMLQLYSKY